MLIHSIEQQDRTGAEVVVYLRLAARLSHVFWVTLCGLLAAGAGSSRSILTLGEALLVWWRPILTCGLVMAVVFQAFGLYGPAMFGRQWRLRPLALACAAGFLLILALRFFSPALHQLGYGGLAAWFGMTLTALSLQRVLAHWVIGHLVRRGRGLGKAVIVGRTESGSRLADFMLEHADLRHRLIGYADDRAERSRHGMAGIPYLGTIADLEALVRAGGAQLILIALPWAAVERMGSIIRDLRRLPVTLLLAPDMAAFHFAHNRITPVAGLPMFNISELPLSGWSPLVKRLEDIALSALALLLFSPLMLLTAVLIKLDSPGPVLFRQKRYGYNNRLIEVFKFRSMYTEMTDHHAASQTTRHDPRVTRVGRFIRKTSIDELPQLFNVLGGSMSMVGPRPHAKATKAAGVLFEEAVDEYTSRHRVKPGITGWAQVKGYRGETDTLEKIEKRVAYDLEYIENWSLWFDLYILALTPLAVLGGEAAY
ncbi:undecaprenyl-phosphate glucose phosphotransferase [uncultured Aquitalea sp.]|uniref:undecaprenyl-phosphate glucose phosphotransferase n=1 Tax=uncultured Aquitalea sp. TaxID=540272 RepID=UPI0025D8B392|nr:undecaprenyl-phosphate glucose phosphotransferase [uncultured Aquitalea sp.]